LQLRVTIAATRAITTSLKFLGLRDHVLQYRLTRAYKARQALSTEDAASWPALHGMDRQLAELFAGLDRPGFFVEAGANDGYTQSNTYWLGRFAGWRGVLIEPMQEFADLCARERPDATVIRSALVPADFEGDVVEMHFGDLMSVVAGEHEVEWRTRFGNVQGWRDPYTAQVPARTLSSILDEVAAPEIDLLSLDVEGYEPEVLRGLDLDRHSPRWILVEVHEDATSRRPVEEVLGSRYTLDRRLSPNDLLYRRTDVSAPGEITSRL
jgi:FkbM family methyltransferase